eukprot:CAMPEP_0184684808 /NCGR_PEP_ID=MMETSP0312-20130426/16784_1 /TAXON_ID=31354 /ORGANISM="Compsopogon coeruleus, Strain SAG 36.94" /LENGTH=181 /DNA_ID=CAMNT_0027138377 /DNA_START=54 /DNA_END=596 /DNA_ORIENTATION=+
MTRVRGRGGRGGRGRGTRGTRGRGGVRPVVEQVGPELWENAERYAEKDDFDENEEDGLDMEELLVPRAQSQDDQEEDRAAAWVTTRLAVDFASLSRLLGTIPLPDRLRGSLRSDRSWDTRDDDESDKDSAKDGDGPSLTQQLNQRIVPEEDWMAELIETDVERTPGQDHSHHDDDSDFDAW